MKSYLRWCISLLLDHFLAVIGAALIFGFLGAWEHWVIVLICELLCLALSLVIPYHESWKVGVHDRNYQKREKVSSKVSRGIIAGVLTSIPSLLVAILAYASNVSGWTLGILLDQSMIEFLYRIWFFPFLLLFDYLEAYPFLYFVPVFVAPIMTAIGYYFGVHKLMLRDYLYYQREKNSSD